MDSYPARFRADGGAVLVTFPDLPEAATGGADEAEAMSNAIDALEVTLLTYAADGKPIPEATWRASSGGAYRHIPVSAMISAKLAFIAAFRASGLTRVALAAKLGKAESEVRRMIDPYHKTKLPAIESGLRALGKRLVVTVEEAA